MSPRISPAHSLSSWKLPGSFLLALQQWWRNGAAQTMSYASIHRAGSIRTPHAIRSRVCRQRKVVHISLNRCTAFLAQPCSYASESRVGSLLGGSRRIFHRIFHARGTGGGGRCDLRRAPVGKGDGMSTSFLLGTDCHSLLAPEEWFVCGFTRTSLFRGYVRLRSSNTMKRLVVTRARRANCTAHLREIDCPLHHPTRRQRRAPTRQPTHHVRRRDHHVSI